MGETRFARSRMAALFGLLLQLAAFAATFALAHSTHSLAILKLAWFILGGVPIWFVCLLVFRQQELAAIEQMDLEELRREKQSTGGGEAIFGAEGGGGLGYMVAHQRLAWMQRWVVPAFGLISAAYLAVIGVWSWRTIGRGVQDAGWPTLLNLPTTTIILAVIMLVLFLFSRYASGMGRVREWSLLRGCGSFMLGNALAALAIIISLGVHMYADVPTWEHVLAYVIPALMVILAAEFALNFVLDIYRPRSPGAVARSNFDSRLLALIAEPGGVASTIAEAINYQFGFRVSQTWFYQLMQRTFIPLVGVGALTLWGLTTLLVVQPYEHAVIERFGRQMNAESPLGPGLHWKLPWPIEVAYKFNTGQLHEIHIGFQQFAAQAISEDDQASNVLLWSDDKHFGQPHFNFVVSPPRGPRTAPASAPTRTEARGDSGSDAVPVHLLRMDVVVQYRIPPSKLAAFTQKTVDPESALLNVAWEEVVLLNASSSVDSLLAHVQGAAGNAQTDISESLRERISARVDALGLGIDIVYVGLQNVHPEPSVSKAFRNVIGAELEKITEIRKALVTENERLSRVAGDKFRAIALARAVDSTLRFDVQKNQSETALRSVPAEQREQVAAPLRALEPVVKAQLAAQFDLELQRERRDRVEQEFALGMGRTMRQRHENEKIVSDAEKRQQDASAALDAVLAPLRESALQRLPQSQFQAVFENMVAQIALDFWSEQLEELIRGLEGEAAVTLAEAQARRWQIEMSAAADVARLLNERDAYRAAPEVYKLRRYLEVLSAGLQHARKYVLAFPDTERRVHLRIQAEEEARPDVLSLPSMNP